MKTIKSIVVAVLLFAGTSVWATETPNEKVGPSTSEVIGDLLKKPGFEVNEQMTAKVKFVLNDEKEIVVLSVKTDRNVVEKFVKSRLNYQKMTTALEEGKEYIVNVVITAEA